MPKRSSPSQADTTPYTARINRAIDHVLQHLDEPLRLERVAKAAGFSPFYFHRIFRSSVGESLADFVKRVRLERALVLMSRRGWATRRRQSLTDIALACGFTSSADFSRCFRQRFGQPPSQFDVAAYRTGQRRDWEKIAAPQYHLRRLPRGANPDGFVVKLRRLPPRCVAYVRVHDSYRPGAVPRAANRLLRWAEARGFADGQWLGYMWDDPEVVAPELCRYDVGLEVPPFRPTEEVSRIDFPAMQVAEVELRGDINLEMRALDWLFKTWLPASGYVPTEQPCFEAWIGRPFAHGMEHFEIKAQIPVEKA